MKKKLLLTLILSLTLLALIPRHSASAANPNAKELVSTAKKAYVITAKPNEKFTNFKSFTITISKKTGNITKIKATNGKIQYSTISGGSFTYSQIHYGETAVELPEELEGRY